MRVAPQSSHCSTWPPSSAVRQAVMAPMMPLDVPEMAGMRLSERFAIAAEDIRHLQSRSHGTRSGGWHDFQAGPIERARRVADRFGGDPGVARRA
jgi:hypothetical protein